MAHNQQRASAMKSAIRLSPAHQRHLAERGRRLERPDDLTLATVAKDGDGQDAFEQDAQESGILAKLDDGLVGFIGDDARFLHELVEAIVAESLQSLPAASRTR